MATNNYSTATQRLATTSPSSNDDESKNSIHKYAISSGTESATTITIKNLGKFSSHYALFMWSVLFITLILNDQVSLTNLLAVTKISFLHFGSMLILPEFVVLIKNATDKRFVWFFLFVMLLLLFVATNLELIQTGGEMFVSMIFAIVVSIILLHAVFSRGEDQFLNGEEGEVASFVQEKGSGDDQSESIV